MKNPPASFVFLLLVFFCAPAATAGVVDLGPAADAQVVEGYPTSNYGSATSMYVASAAGGPFLDERSWVKFDLSDQVPPGTAITSARLRLFCWKADAADSLETAVHSSSDDSWAEPALTWNNQPAFDPTALDANTLVAGRSDYWAEWSVTAFVQSRFIGDRTASFVVKAADDGQDPWPTFAFNSKEFSAALAPRLRIDYSGEWPSGGGFKIFHMNDAHSRLMPHEFDVPETDDVPGMEMVGGAPWFAARMLALKSTNPNSLILDAGDISEGNPLGDLRGSGGMIDFYNLLDTKLKALGGRGIDAVVGGNHDVRSRQMLNNMKPAAQGAMAGFPVVSVTVCQKGTQNPYFTPYVTVIHLNGFFRWPRLSRVG